LSLRLNDANKLIRLDTSSILHLLLSSRLSYIYLYAKILSLFLSLLT